MKTAKKIFKEYLLSPMQSLVEAERANKILLLKQTVTIGRDARHIKCANFLMATGKGLYLITKEGDVKTLLSGYFFGIAKNGSTFYVFQGFENSGRILSFQIEETVLKNLKIFIKRISKNIHQIVFFDQKLFITDPANNCILLFNKKGNLDQCLYPLGKLISGKQSKNYAHFNSIFPYKNRIYVLAHNYSQHSNRKSSLLLLNRRTFQLEEIIESIGSCAHNIIIQEQRQYVCDSWDGVVRDHGKEVARFDMFTRGLAMNDEHIIVGGSIYAASYKERYGKDCFIYILDKTLLLKDTIRFQQLGPCNDIRFIENDYGYGQGLKKAGD